MFLRSGTTYSDGFHNTNSRFALRGMTLSRIVFLLWCIPIYCYVVLQYAELGSSLTMRIDNEFDSMDDNEFDAVMYEMMVKINETRYNGTTSNNESKQQFNSHNVSKHNIVGNVLYAKESYIVALVSVITWKMAPCLRTSAYGPAVWKMASCLRTSASGPAVDSKHSAVAVAKYELMKAAVGTVITFEKIVAPWLQKK
jgi:hypothetical protein